MNKGMKKHVMKATACFAAGTMLLTGSQMAALAAGNNLVGVETTKPVETPVATKKEAVQDEVQEEEAEETAQEVSMVGTLAVAQPGDEGCFNVRAAADTDADVVGYLYENNFATILGEEGDFYYVQSGNCIGYVAKYLMTTGVDAAEVMEEVATPVAQINAEALMVRSDMSEDAEVLDTVSENELVYLEEDCGGWAKISVGETTGYVNADYVSYASYLPQGESAAEADARIAAEEAAYEAWLAEQERLYLEAMAAEQAAWEAQNQEWIEYLQSTGQYADEAQATADQAAADSAYAEQVAADAEQVLNDAYSTGDEDTIAYAEQQYAEAQANAQAAADAQATAQAEADAASAEFDVMVENAGIDASEVAGDTGVSAKRQAIVDYALQFVGNPYVWGGTSLTNGADCSGFTQSVLADNGISVNRTAGQQSQGGTSVSLDNIQPGDLLFYEGSGDYGIGHVTMYIGNGQVVHASSSTTGIIVSDMDYRTPVSAKSYINE